MSEDKEEISDKNGIVTRALDYVLNIEYNQTEYDSTLGADYYFNDYYQKNKLELQVNFQTVDFLNQSHILNIYKERLSEEFLPDRLFVVLRANLESLVVLRSNIKVLDTPFIPCNLIEKYLSLYYSILTIMLAYECNSSSSEVLRDIFDIMLNLDTCGDKVSLLCPMALNATRKMYLEADEYYKRVSKRDKPEGKKLSAIDILEQSVVEKKVWHTYRWYFYDKERGFMHVALPYDYRKGIDGSVWLQAKSIKDYNSFEGIGELRTAEKILYELKKFIGVREKSDEDKIKFSVALLGDLNKDALEELAQYVGKVVTDVNGKIKENIRVIYNCYSKNFKGENEDSNIVSNERMSSVIHYENGLNNVLTRRSELEKILASNNCVFFLDCVDLYEPLTKKQTDNIEYEKRNYILGKPFSSTTMDKIDISAPNMLDTLYDGLVGCNSMNTYGNINKYANNGLLLFCEDYINKIDRGTDRHSLYGYVSDLLAFKRLYCSDSYYVRTERYNQKEIGIIRYTGENKENFELPVKSIEDSGEKLLISFNVWQVIKHINMEKRNDIIKAIAGDSNAGEIKDYELHRLFVGIDYTKWREELVFHYGIDDTNWAIDENKKVILTDFLRKFINTVVLPIFNDSQEDMFKQYIWRAIKSFLYGDAKSVEDMLFIHLWNKGLTGKCRLADINDGDIVIKNINKIYKYSIKRFYEMIMSDFDISAQNSYDQRRIATKVDIADVEGGKSQLFENVLAACERLNYKDSYLYSNCKFVLRR
jgi:hypothetical protein